METDEQLIVLMEDPELLKVVLSQLADSERGYLLDRMSTKLLKRAESMDMSDDLDRVIAMEEEAIELIPNDPLNRARMLNNLGIALQDRFERAGSIEDLNRAISTNEKAVELSPNDHPDHVEIFNNLGVALCRRFERTGLMEDLNRAISIFERAIELTPVNSPSRARWLNNLGNALRRRFGRTGSMKDLDRAVSIKEQVLDLTPNDHPNCAVRLNNLGTVLLSRFERKGSIDDLDRAISTIEEAVRLTSNDHHFDRAARLSNLGVALRKRFQRNGSIEDLNHSISTIEEAVELTSVKHPNYAEVLSNLGNALQSRFERIGSMEDLNRAVRINEHAVELTPNNHPGRARRLNDLGVALWRRFQMTGSTEDLNRAISTKEEAVQSTPSDHTDRAEVLNNLGIALLSQFMTTGSMADLDRTISTIEQAVELTPNDHPGHARRLNNLGVALWRRFERIGSMEDLNAAIPMFEHAIELTPLDHPNRAGWFYNLGNALQSRFERTGAMDDLNHAISLKEDAVELTPVNHSDYATRVSNLGVALWRRCERTGSMEDLNHAVSINEQAVQLTSLNHHSCAARLNNLGIVLYSLYRRTGEIEDLNRAISKEEQAVELTPLDHPDLAGRLNNLGNALQRRFEKTGSIEDLNRAISIKEKALKSDTAPPSIRLIAAHSCSDWLIKQRSYCRAKPILQAAVKLLPRISPRQLKRSDAQFNISQFASVTCRAVSLSMEDTELFNSLQLLELGRGILASLQLEVRSDISVLAASHPGLSRQFEELRDQIDRPSTTFESSVIEDSLDHFDSIFLPDASKSISEHRALLKRFDNLLEHIRSLQGFENFLRGPSKPELHSLAEGGPIVVFNVSDIRSDAFLITTDAIRSISLPLLTSSSLMSFANRFVDAISGLRLIRYRHALSEMNGVLGWLWRSAVKPILDELGFAQMPQSGDEWPRVWWIGSGLLSILPIHASGDHDSGSQQTALDRVISSYASTVKSLAYARERAARADQVTLKENAILIAMPTTPGQGSLEFVEEEIKNLQNLLSNASIDTTIIQNPVRAVALSELSKYSIVHFACHGYSAEDPSQSSLILEDWKTVPLTVSDLISLNIMSAKLAYLSVCHGSTMRDFSLLDESISLSSAIQLCGYPSVVSSLWQIRDSYSSNVARDVYMSILEGNCGLDARRSAEGLHKAVRHLRDRSRFMGKQDPLIWAPFIHIGI